jgi:hypothetical protein
MAVGVHARVQNHLYLLKMPGIPMIRVGAPCFEDRATRVKEHRVFHCLFAGAKWSNSQYRSLNILTTAVCSKTITESCRHEVSETALKFESISLRPRGIGPHFSEFWWLPVMQQNYDTADREFRQSQSRNALVLNPRVKGASYAQGGPRVSATARTSAG